MKLLIGFGHLVGGLTLFLAVWVVYSFYCLVDYVVLRKERKSWS